MNIPTTKTTLTATLGLSWKRAGTCTSGKVMTGRLAHTE